MMMKQMVKELADLVLQVFKVGEQMKLEEAIENIKEYIAKLDDYIEHLYDENGSFKKQKETYITILQELEHLQEENKELRRKLCIS